MCRTRRPRNPGRGTGAAELNAFLFQVGDTAAASDYMGGNLPMDSERAKCGHSSPTPSTTTS